MAGRMRRPPILKPLRNSVETVSSFTDELGVREMASCTAGSKGFPTVGTASMPCERCGESERNTIQKKSASQRARQLWRATRHLLEQLHHLFVQPRVGGLDLALAVGVGCHEPLGRLEVVHQRDELLQHGPFHAVAGFRLLAVGARPVVCVLGGEAQEAVLALPRRLLRRGRGHADHRQLRLERGRHGRLWR